MKILLLAALLLSINCTYAANKNYNANLENSLWYISSSTPIQCTLEHPIPRYGQAHFEARASKNINLDFILHSKRALPETRLVTLKSVPPQWHPGAAAQTIGQVKFYQQFDGYVTRQKAWQMLSELEDGKIPTFYFHDWYNKDQITSVGLSSVNFMKSYDDFNNCIDQLLPYNFDDIAYSILKYNKNGVQLTSFSKKRLKMIGDYIKHDEAINVVLVSGYSDSYGAKHHNLQLSEKRATSVKEYLAKIGLDNEQIQVAGYGEKHHVADNSTVLGRMQNRRVVISIEREDI
ncbi:sodium-type flagellar protein MotY [Psychromonas marina]|uniref:Sodium-type flagellar protein MotY n=1 Tax=Psychromonas marina TaxID=88364 RepID=A0ABQ6E1Q2_9GAMM|nr:OmpA family protein [Psychromonas marina]GLS91148.1 sodium-type flagellar protein MotY [Psychromonas marina]